MPAAAVIPAPIVYINIVAVKKLVVEFLRESILSGLKELQKKMIYLTLSFFHRWNSFSDSVVSLFLL